jgi:hypothetical protein
MPRVRNAKVSRPGVAVLALFLVSHTWLALAYLPKASDALLYSLYAFVIKDAARLGRSPYDHFEASKRQAAQGAGMPPPRSDQVTLEYPPLALGLMLAPLPFVPKNAAGIPGIEQNDASDWRHGFRLLYFSVHALVVGGMVWWLSRRKFPWYVGLFVSTLSGIVLGYVLYDRLDLWLGLAVAGGLAALVTGHRYVALALLAVAVNFKLVPVVLLPLFVLGTLPASVLAEGFVNRRALKVCVVGCTAFVAACIAVFLPFRLMWGSRVWDFLSHHSQRGFQIESTWSSLLLLAGHLGYPIRMAHSFGANGLEGPGLSFLSKASSLVALAIVGLAYWLILRALMRRRAEAAVQATHGQTLAGSHPQLFVWGAFAVVAFAIASSKVFSPQYLCWFLPCFLLVEPPRDARAAAPLAVFLLVCGLTTIVFPVLWSEVVRPVSLVENTPVLLPTVRVTLVMLARNLLWIGFCALAIIQLRRTALPLLTAPPPPPSRTRKRYRRT